MKVLILTPQALYRRWPTTPDTTKMMTNAAPVTMAQLAGALKGHEVRILDGNGTHPLGGCGRHQRNVLLRRAEHRAEP